MGSLENFDMRIEFDPGALPAVIWWAVWDGIEGRILEQEEVSPDPQHSVHRYLRSMERSVVGFHWCWPGPVGLSPRGAGRPGGRRLSPRGGGPPGRPAGGGRKAGWRRGYCWARRCFV